MCNPRSMWGTVCGNQWTEANSRVVCSSLGYSVEEGTYQVSSTFKKTPTVPIAVDFVKCQGSENSLKDCVHFSHSYSECGHSDDVGVRCQADDCIDGDVRLFEYLGRYDYEKRQYVLVCINKRWGPICSNNRQGNSKTLCNQFGYNGGYGGEGLISMPVQNITLQCSGDESRISDCPFDNSIPSSCYSHISIDCKNAYCTDGQVRLVDGATDVEGRVEICFSRRWGTISGDGWTQAESTVVCNDLGYEATDKDYSLRPAPNSMPVLLKGVRCTGKELSLLECGYRRAPIVLNHVKDVAVRCKSECDDGDLRLVGGDSENDGLLQVCFSGRWGTVNRDGWTDVDTHVACRQLGFNNAGQYSANAVRNTLSTPIYMDNIGCHGTEARLTDCAYHRDTSEDSHSGDVWIDCSSSSNSANNIESDNSTATDSGDNVTGLIVALVALVGLVLLSIAFVGYILWSKRLHKKMRVYYRNSAQGKGEGNVKIPDEPDSKDYEIPKRTTATQDAHYASLSSSPPAKPSGIYQPLKLSTLERESCYAAPQKVTRGNGGGKGKNPPPPLRH
ncbi:Neurotrypsin [Geodia barretti]|uniref:Neurotrypsin n=1 Tax=Geodia barretti TaxID=519541 RepID=A0AA35WJ13_GEOBA|nr:Neurotrypsin [Geodia barretti]